MPAPKGNQYGAKPPDEVAGSFLHVRCRQLDKARWVRAANGRKMKLAEWVVEVLNSRSGQ